MVKDIARRFLALLLAASLLTMPQGFALAGGNIVSGQVNAEAGAGTNSAAAVGHGTLLSLPRLEVGLSAGNDLAGALQTGISLTPVVKTAPPPSILVPGTRIESAAIEPATEKPLFQTETPVAIPAAVEDRFVAQANTIGSAPNSISHTASLHSFATDLAQRLKDPFHTTSVQADVPAVDPAIGSEPVFPADAPQSLAEASLDIDPNRTYTPSPGDWRDEIMYSVFLDRFARSPNGKPLGDPTKGDTRHGGDLRGLISKLDYIQGSGVTTIILNPVVLGIPEAYHGYAPLHLLAVDPQLGTMADFKELVAEAHKRGLHVIFDLLINHVGPVFEYKDGSQWKGMDQPPKEIGVWNHKLFPTEMAAPENFTRHGVIGNWDDHEQAINGDFPPNYRHWASDKPEVQEKLIHMACWWLKETDIDGFRIDAIRHINPAFRGRFSSKVRKFASMLGKENLFILGENSTGLDEDVAHDLKDAGIDSAYAYPEYRRLNWALHGKAPARAIEDSLYKAASVLGSSISRLLRFIDLHDTYRFLRAGEPVSLLKMAMAFMFFSIGIPLVYYGTEQAFQQMTDRLDPEGPQFPADPENRPDMFPEGQYKFPSSAGDKFDVNSPTYQWVRQLSDLRKDHLALSRGEQYVRWSHAGLPGIYAFSRIYEGEEVLVAINTSVDTRTADMVMDAKLTPGGTELEDAINPGYKINAYTTPDGGSQVRVEVPPHGVRVFVRARTR